MSLKAACKPLVKFTPGYVTLSLNAHFFKPVPFHKIVTKGYSSKEEKTKKMRDTFSRVFIQVQRLVQKNSFKLKKSKTKVQNNKKSFGIFFFVLLAL